MIVIAIDGPSGSGKSTVARQIAADLHLPYLDTGAMYRAVGFLAMKKTVDFGDEKALTKLATEMKIQLLDERKDGVVEPRVVLNAIDVTLDLRTVECSQAASAVAVHPQVRERLVKRQRHWVEERGGGVVEGRDIGTVVFPEADLKVFLTASEAERIKRRQSDAGAPAFSALSNSEAEKQIAERDRRDSTRSASPLLAAPDALLIDTGGTSPTEIVMEIMMELRKRTGGELPKGNA